MEALGRPRLDFFTLLEEDLEVLLAPEVFEGLIDEGVQLVVLRMQEDLLLPETYQSHTHVQQVIFVLLIHEEVEDFIHERYLHVPMMIYRLTWQRPLKFLG